MNKSGVFKSCLLILLVLFTLSFIVYAQQEITDQSLFNEQISYDWLKNNLDTSMSIMDRSLVIMALNNHGDDVSERIVELNSKKSVTGNCWPASGCNVKDTAMAIMALDLTGQDVTQEKNWLMSESVLVPGVSSGEWRVQIQSPSNGTCSVNWNNNTQTKEFQIIGNEILQTNGKYYINVATDLSPNLISSNVGSEMNVDCSQMSGAIIISLLYTKGNDIFILDSVASAKANLKIVNGCHSATGNNNACDYESSLYATWALVEMGEDLEQIGTQTYLESSLPNDDISVAILARTLNEAGYAKSLYYQKLADAQRSDGSWAAGDKFTSAMASFGLQGASSYIEVLNSGLDWLKYNMANDGSWNQDVGDTAMALIALHGKDLSLSNTDVPTAPILDSGEICDDLQDNDGDGLFDCNDPDCDYTDVCPSPELSDINNIETECDDYFDDDNDGLVDCEDSDCDFDSACATSTDTFDTDITNDNLNFNEKKSFTWLWVLILLLIAVGGGVFFYVKFIKTGRIDLKSLFKKNKKGPTFDQYLKQQTNKPLARPNVVKPTTKKPMQPLRKPVVVKKRPPVEDELSKSLKEAERLLKGGK